jgi:hypothetical protein
MAPTTQDRGLTFGFKRQIDVPRRRRGRCPAVEALETRRLLTDHLVLTATPPATVSAGSGFGLAVAVENSQGQVDASYTAAITLALASNPNQDTLGGQITLGAVKGVAVFQGLTLDKTTANLSVQASSGTLAPVTTGSVTVKPGALHAFALKYASITTAGTPNPLTVTALDAEGNVVSDYAGAVHFTSTDSKAGLPPEYTFTAADVGVHTFLVPLVTAGPQALRATDTVHGSWTGLISGIQVSPGAVHSMFANYTLATTAGTKRSLIVEAYDAYGNRDTDYTGTVRFTSSDTHALLPADYTFTPADAGLHIFTAVLRTAGTWAIRGTDAAHPSLTSLRSGIVVSPAAASRFSVSFPTSTTAGANETLTVTALDPYGNVARGYTGTIHFASNDFGAMLPADYTFTAADLGRHTFMATLARAGTDAIWATDTGQDSVTGLVGGIVVRPSVMDHFQIHYATTVMAGAWDDVWVVAVDTFGNVVPSYTGTIHFSASDPRAEVPPDLTFTASDKGYQGAWIQMQTTGTQSIGVVDTANPGLTGQEGGITVTPGNVKGFIVTFPTDATAGDAGALLVLPVDAFGNLASHYTGTIHFTSDDTHAILPPDYTFTTADNGSHLFIVTLETAGMRAIRATDTSNTALTGLATGLDVAPAEASRLVVSGYPTAAARGTPSQFTVTLYDAYGNVDTNYAGTLHFTSDDPLALLPADWTFTAADAGSRTFAATLRTAGMHTLKATDTRNPDLEGAETDILIS